MEWTSAMDARLAETWGSGLTGSEIARRLNDEFGTLLTSNAVIGRAHRTRLSARPSPIIRVGGGHVALKAARPKPKAKAIFAPKPPRQSVDTPPYTPDPAQITDTSSLYSRCAFPSWPHDSRPTHEYCGQAVEPGHPYCSAHCRVAFTGAPQKAEAL